MLTIRSFTTMSLSTALLTLFPAMLVGAEEMPAKTALDDYIAAQDDSYSWKIVEQKSASPVTSVVVDMVSQTWRTPADVDRTEWQHWLTVALPKEFKSNVGMLLIGGGRNGREPPQGPDDIVQAISDATGTVVAELHMVPNQPLVFHDDGERRSEDDLIAYTWVQYLETGDPTWPARNPMVKSAVRAMDTITALTSEHADRGPAVEKFVVAGGSKRGWTTWLTGAVDPRVVAIVPIVIDVLNVQAAVGHHFGAYGFWAPSVGDYVEHGITQQQRHPRIQELYNLVDPFSYRHRLTMPKFIVNAAGDQFFPPDSSQFYFDQLVGPKYLRYVPNADHSLDDTDALESITAFYSLVLAGGQPPRFTWTKPRAGLMEVQVEDAPREVRLWQATNPHARDFRMETLGPKYESRVLEADENGNYVAEVSAPPEGWTAYFVELTYDALGKVPIKLTTDVCVVPDTLPFADKDSTLPPTITVECQCPSAEEAGKIKQAVGQETIPGVDGPLRVAAGADENESGAVQLSLNWKPAGRFEASARAITAWLESRNCSDFAYRLESGWYLPAAD